MAEDTAQEPQEPQEEKKDSSEAIKNPPQAEATEFADLEPSEVPEEKLKLILDIPLEIRVELGRSKMIIKELLQLGQGSVIELNKAAGEPLDIYVNDRLIAKGETVVVNEKYGIRLTDIISPLERIKMLGE